MEDMKKWVKSGDFRSITIESHCHGVRVTLKEGFGFNVSVTAVQDNILDAFKECIVCLPNARINWKKREMERLQENIAEEQKELDSKKERLKELKNEGGI